MKSTLAPLPPQPALVPLALTLLCALPAGQACAQDPAPQTVTVTAKGYAAAAAETPFAVTTLDRESLLQRQAQNPGDALRGEPGLSVASDSAQGQNPVIRGLKRESIVLLVDGLRLNSAQPAGAIASFMSLGLADRVEVVKGPASVLYGTGALGGAIQVRLPQARFSPGVELEASAGFDSASRGLRTTGLGNVSAGDFAWMLGASAARIDDYEAPAGKVPLTGYDSDALISQLRWRLDARQQWRASLQTQRDADVWYPGSKKPHPNQAVVGNTLVHSPVQRRNLLELGYERKGMGEQPLNLDVRLYRQDVDRSIQPYSDRLQRDIGRTRVSFATTGLDARADWLPDARHQLSFGLNAWRMQASPERYLAFPTPASPLVRNDPFSEGTLRSVGLYLQDDMRFGALNLLAGARYDRVEGDAASMNNGAVTQGLRREDGAASGSLGLIYQVSPLLRPYANLSRAFRAGEMRERFESSPRGDGFQYIGNPQIEPEFATQFEIGLKGEAKTLEYTAAVYENRITDYITGVATGGFVAGLPVKQTVNLGKVVIRGLEGQLRWQFHRDQWLSAAVSALRGENRDLHEPLFQMPADELSLGWKGRVAAAWTADATLRLVARQDRVATVFARGTEDATAGFATLDLGATWRYAPRQWLRLALRNLADKAYHEHLAEGISGHEIQAPGRSLQLTWQGAF